MMQRAIGYISIYPSIDKLRPTGNIDAGSRLQIQNGSKHLTNFVTLQCNIKPNETEHEKCNNSKAINKEKKPSEKTNYSKDIV